MKTENYRPAHIEFNVMHDEKLMPESFGEFGTPEEVSKFIGSNLISLNQGVTVSRYMDIKEKTELRKEYNDVLENKLPVAERELSIAQQELTAAKKKFSDCQSSVDAAIYEAKSIAFEVKRGLKEMNLDENFTYRIAFKNRYYFYTYIDKQIRLCKINDIPSHEKNDIFNQMAENEAWIEKTFGDESAKA